MIFFLKADKWHRRLVSKELLLVSFGDICWCAVWNTCFFCSFEVTIIFEAFCSTTKIALLSFSFQKTGHSNRTFGRFTHGVFGFIDNRLLQERFYDNSSESVSHLMSGLCLKSRMHWLYFALCNLKESADNLAIYASASRHGRNSNWRIEVMSVNSSWTGGATQNVLLKIELEWNVEDFTELQLKQNSKVKKKNFSTFQIFVEVLVKGLIRPNMKIHSLNNP